MYPYFRPNEGDLIAALFEDAWYRARVKSVSNDRLDVLYVDYGNFAQVSVQQCHPLPQQYADGLYYKAQFAIRLVDDLTPKARHVLLTAANALLADGKGECRVKVTKKRNDNTLVIDFVGQDWQTAKTRAAALSPPSIATAMQDGQEIVARLEGDLDPDAFVAMVLDEGHLTDVIIQMNALYGDTKATGAKTEE